MKLAVPINDGPGDKLTYHRLFVGATYASRTGAVEVPFTPDTKRCLANVIARQASGPERDAALIALRGSPFDYAVVYARSLFRRLTGISVPVDDASVEDYSYYAGKRYTFTITSKMQAHCPKWNPDKSPNPPLSAAKALASARKFISTIEHDPGYKWELDDLSLVDACGWAWRARFELHWLGAASSGQPFTMHCWVLMDGTVVQPLITLHDLYHPK